MYGHRVHLLLDDERYRRVTSWARERNTSVSAVIRDSIDRTVPDVRSRREAAWRRIEAAEPMPVPDDPADLRRELDEARDRFD